MGVADDDLASGVRQHIVLTAGDCHCQTTRRTLHHGLLRSQQAPHRRRPAREYKALAAEPLRDSPRGDVHIYIPPRAGGKAERVEHKAPRDEGPRRSAHGTAQHLQHGVRVGIAAVLAAGQWDEHRAIVGILRVGRGRGAQKGLPNDDVHARVHVMDDQDVLKQDMAHEGRGRGAPK